MIKETIYAECPEGGLTEIYFSVTSPQKLNDADSHGDWSCDIILKSSDGALDSSVALYNVSPSCVVISALTFITQMIETASQDFSWRLRYSKTGNDYMDSPRYPLD